MTSKPPLPHPGEVITGTGQLHGWGRRTWPELTAALAAAHAAWADYDGFHLGPCPENTPPYTHLWAWTEGWLVRARVDGGHAIIGALVLNGDPPDLGPAITTETVPYQRRTGRTWTAGEQRIGPLPAGVPDRLVEQYQVPGQQPVTFVAVR